ncbi:MAG TPA: ATP-binding protein [Candidatus Babeliales bacterium]|nr:ATP-binding protein [Candidatus Babeliales bacterium]
MKLFKLITLLTAGSLALPAHLQANMFSELQTNVSKAWGTTRATTAKAYETVTKKFTWTDTEKTDAEKTEDQPTPWYIRHKGKLIATGATAATMAAVYAYVRLNPTSNTSIRIKEAYKNSMRFLKRTLGLYGKEQPLPDHLKSLNEALIKRSISREDRELILQGAQYYNATPEQIKKYCLKTPGHLLFYGPPGTGKTSIVAELAKIISPDQKFEAVLPADLDSTSKIADLFAHWREQAKKARKFILFDEGDAVFTRTEANATLFNTLLQEIASKQNTNITFVAATNFKDAFPESILRAERMESHILIPNPNGRSRMMLLQENLGKLPAASLALSWIDKIRLAILTRGFNIADINALIQKAGFSALKHNRAISMADFNFAINMIRKSKGL